MSITKEMSEKINNRIDELVNAGAAKELSKKGLNEQEIKSQLITEAICSLLGI